MKIELREISLQDEKEFFDMIKEIGPGENGFENHDYDMEYSKWPNYLREKSNESKGIDLKPGYVSQTTYWLLIDDKPVGYSKLRHDLTEKLMHQGGNLGYIIKPTERGKKYGNIILEETIKKAKELGIKELLLTCNQDNGASRKIIENNGGKFHDISPETQKCRYWIKL